MTSEIPLRIVLVRPPVGVAFCLQRGQGSRAQLLGYQVSTGSDLAFELTVNMRRADGEAFSFLGPFTQGTPSQRFFYICCGRLAGQQDSPWERRVKIHLSGISAQLAEQVANRAGAVLEARYLASARDGGPACASVPLLEEGWRLVAPTKDAG